MGQGWAKIVDGMSESSGTGKNGQQASEIQIKA